VTRAKFRELFLLERAKFGRRYPKVARAGLGLLDRYATPRSPGGYRDVAFANITTNMVWFVGRALRMPRANLVGLLRHELGHLADPTPQKKGAEARADRIAWAVTGKPVRYDAKDVQNACRGRLKRPAHLHQ